MHLLLLLALAAQPAPPSAAQIAQLLRAGRYEEALAEARAAERANPRDARPYTLEGLALSLSNQGDAALPAFEHALRLAPEDPAALRGAVELLYPKRDPRAIPLLERVLAHAPNDTTAHEMLARLEQAAGDCQTANAHFAAAAEAIQTHPGSLEAYGACLVESGQPAAAVPLFQQLVALAPQSTDARYDLAVVLASNKQQAEALAALLPLLDAHTPDPDVLSLAAGAYEATGDTPHAVATLREAIVLRPDDPALYSAFVRLCLDHDSVPVGIDMVNAGLKRLPANPQMFLLRGLLYAQLSRFDEAEADFATADRLDARGALGAYALDLAELDKNSGADAAHPQVAIARLRGQLRTHPESPMLHYLLARLLVMEADGGASTSADLFAGTAPPPAEAFEQLAHAIRLKGDFVPARDLLASLYLRKGDDARAIEQCREAVRYAPNDRTALYHLATALRHSSRPEDHAEMQALLKQVAALQRAALAEETRQKSFKLSDASSPHD